MPTKDKLKIVSVRLVQDRPLLSKKQIRNQSDAVYLLMDEMRSWSREGFWVLYVDGGHYPIGATCASVGTINRTPVHPREVFQAAILANAAAIIVLHNHPSGNAEPSQEDINVTKTLFQASKIIGIELLDHLVVGKEKYYSFAENKLMQHYEPQEPEKEESLTLPGLFDPPKKEKSKGR